MIKLRTLLTVFIFTLKAGTRDYAKGRHIFRESVGQSEQTVLVGMKGFVENDTFEKVKY